MRIFRFSFIILLFLVLSLNGCRQHPAPVILVSEIYNDNFRKWLRNVDEDLAIIDMYRVSQDSIEYFLMHSSGIIISGGADMNPALYGREDGIGKCEGIDYRRDTLDIRMIRYAMENNIPLLCICRGIQILNVANGGTLILDIPSDYDTIIQHRGVKCKHLVNLVEGTLLNEICQTRGDTVNSTHHQAVNEISSLFRVTAYAEDGLIEAMELADSSDHPFMIGVQWHPEGMEFSNPLSGPIAERFIDEAKKKARQK
jgi:putative glutamine amidotransferase